MGGGLAGTGRGKGKKTSERRGWATFWGMEGGGEQKGALLSSPPKNTPPRGRPKSSDKAGRATHISGLCKKWEIREGWALTRALTHTHSHTDTPDLYEARVAHPSGWGPRERKEASGWGREEGRDGMAGGRGKKGSGGAPHPTPGQAASRELPVCGSPGSDSM